MKVLWYRVVGAALVVVGLVFCAVHSTDIAHFFSGMRHIGSFDREQHVMGLVAFGVLLFLLVVFARIVNQRRS